MLSKQAKAELQRMVDKGAEHMRQQGAVSMNDEGICAYRGAEGFKCFIGALIPDEHYTSSLEGCSVYSDSVLYSLKRSGYKVDCKGFKYALEQAQEVLHDDLKHSDTFLKDFEANLKDYCNEYGLIYREPV